MRTSPHRDESTTRRLRRWVRVGAPVVICAGALLVMLLTLPASGMQLHATPPPPAFPNGIAAGDVTTTTAVLWARSTVTGDLTFAVTSQPTRTARVVDVTRPVTVVMTGLEPGVEVGYTVTTAFGDSLHGRVRTPAAAGFHGLRFGVSGDWRGELAPYPALRNVTARDLDFFVALGDTIYADVPSPAVDRPQAETAAEFRAKHAEVYGTHLGMNTWAEIRGDTALFAMVDDHEVMNDFAGGAPAADDPRFPETDGLVNETVLYARGMQAFMAYNPLAATVYADAGDARTAGRPQLYRTRTFGHDAAIFLLDARSFRDAPITPLQNQFDLVRFLRDAFTPGRTMLGAPQLAQLKVDLLAAQARGVTWKFIMVPEPVQNLGPILAQDRFEGYAAERTELLRFIAENNIDNVVFVAADIHGTLVNNLTYQSGAGMAQQPTDTIEVTTGPVAYDAPVGPTLMAQAAAAGLLDAADLAAYRALTTRADKDAFVLGFVDELLALLGYDAVGLAGAPVEAQLLAGDYVSLHAYGWTEFAVDAGTQQLTVTTYGIDPYTADDLAATPDQVTARVPAIVSQFVVTPTRTIDQPQVFLPLVR